MRQTGWLTTKIHQLLGRESPGDAKRRRPGMRRDALDYLGMQPPTTEQFLDSDRMSGSLSLREVEVTEGTSEADWVQWEEAVDAFHRN